MLSSVVERVIEANGRCSIIDIGGTSGFWDVWREPVSKWGPVEITCVNLNPSHLTTTNTSPQVRIVQGDACNLAQVRDLEFDIAFSNSVIEHVGCWSNMIAMAREVQRVAPYYMVQTPNFWFPLEPHARTAFIHWLPEQMAYRIVMRRQCGFWGKQSTVSGAVSAVQSAQLIDAKQLQALFPGARIYREPFLGITKSLIAFSPTWPSLPK